MKKSKRMMSIMTAVAMIGSIFGTNCINSVFAYAETNNQKSQVEALGQKEKLKKANYEINCNSLNFLGQENSSTGIGNGRISGKSRYETSAEITKSGWSKSDYAIIATGENFPDALCAAPLAKKYDAPIILTTSNELNSNAKDQLVRLNVKSAIIIGGTGAVSQAVEKSITDLGISVTRLSGKNRYETSAKVAAQVGLSSQVTIATGNDFPDALSIASIAAMKGMPILLTDKSSLPLETQNYIASNKNITSTYVIGGQGVISDDAVKGLKGVKRLAGSSRYETNKSVMTEFKSSLNSGNVYVATGQNFPDALACSALAPLSDSPIILADQGSESSAQAYIEGNIDSVGNIIAVGGTGAVSDTVLNNATNNYGKKVNNPVVASPFKDKNLERAVRIYIGKSTGSFRKNDFNKVIKLDASKCGISDITGIEVLKNLKSLKLGGDSYNPYGTNIDNTITDISKLSLIKNLNEIYLDHNKISNFTPLNGFVNLKSLSLEDTGIKDISFLSNFKNLKSLNLSKNQINDFKVLLKLNNLHELLLGNTNIPDLNLISSFTKLEVLDLAGDKITDISQLKGLTNLRILNLDCDEVNNVSIIGTFTNMQDLTLYGTQITNINSLKGLTSLQKLELNSTALTDIKVLSNFVNLSELDIYFNNISDLNPIKNLTKIKYLTLLDCKASDISALSNLTNMQFLYLDGNNISDIKALSGLKNIDFLVLDNNKITDITPLKGLTKIYYFEAVNNNIKKIDALHDLIKMENLDLAGNEIDDISVLQNLTQLEALYLEDNNISNVKPLMGLSKLYSLNLEKNNIASADKDALKKALPNCSIKF